MTGVNIVGSQLVAKAQTVIVYVVLGILVLFAIVTSPPSNPRCSPRPDTRRCATSSLASP